MRNLIFISSVISSIFIFSCNKESEIVSIDCGLLTQGLSSSNNEQVKIEIDKVTADLFSESTESDELGQNENIDLLIERLNSHCESIEASLVCYACIRTLIPQSEISIKFDSSSVEIERILDIRTPDDDILSYIRMH